MLILAGCGHSPPMHYVTLSAAPAQAAGAMPAMQAVQLTAVHIPAELDRPEVVTQIAPNRLAIDDNHRWGAPLARMMRRTLAQDLVMRLPAGAFVFPDAPVPADTRTLVVTILGVQADARGALKMQASWTLLSGQPTRATLTREATLETAAPASTADDEAADAATAQAAAMSRVLGMLADRIAASIAAH
ncbi:ABC-type transport auxiliary lipoprotein family protein [Paraburkholderia sp. A1RI-2L]|uniref:PqiC family protein n=1 Tax=Paraburkholderia sp. A1RI-2L TaxID=3028367 RepID=UPI003B7F3550